MNMYNQSHVASAAAKHASRNVTAADKAERMLPRHLSYEWLLLETSENGENPMREVLEPYDDATIYRKVGRIYLVRERRYNEAFLYEPPCRLSKNDITGTTNLARYLKLPASPEDQLLKLDRLVQQRKTFLADKKAGIKSRRRRDRAAAFKERFQEAVEDTRAAIRVARAELDNAEQELDEFEQDFLDENADEYEGYDRNRDVWVGRKESNRDDLTYEQISRIRKQENVKKHSKAAKKIAQQSRELDFLAAKPWVAVDKAKLAKETRVRKPRLRPIQQTELEVDLGALGRLQEEGAIGPGNSYVVGIHNCRKGKDRVRSAKTHGNAIDEVKVLVKGKEHVKRRIRPFNGPSRIPADPVERPEDFWKAPDFEPEVPDAPPLIAVMGSHGEITEADGVRVHHRHAPSGVFRYVYDTVSSRPGGRHLLASSEGDSELITAEGPSLRRFLSIEPSWTQSYLNADPEGNITITNTDLAGRYVESMVSSALIMWRSTEEPFGQAMLIAEVLGVGSYYAYDVVSDSFTPDALEGMLSRRSAAIRKERLVEDHDSHLDDIHASWARQLLASRRQRTVDQECKRRDSVDSFEHLNGANGEFTGTDGHVISQLSGSHGEWTMSDDVKTKGVPKAEIDRRKQQSRRDRVSQERGNYRSLGARLGGAVGKKIGGKTGGKAGRAIGHATQQLFGRGSYALRGTGDMTVVGNNTLPDLQDPFDFATDTQGDIILSRSEYVCKVYAPPTDSYACIGISINPGLAAFAPMMAQMAPNFQQYQIEQMAALFRPVTGLVTSGSMGQITMAFSYNPADVVPETVLQLKGYTGQVTFTPIQRAICGLECDPRKLAVDGGKYIRSGAVPEGQDIKTYDTAILWVGAYNINASVFPAGSTLGELSVVYRVRLIKPRIFDAIGLGIPTDCFWSTSGVSATKVFGSIGSERWSPDCTIGGTTIGTDNDTYRFPDGFNGTVTMTLISTGAQTTFTSAVLGSSTITAHTVWLRNGTPAFSSDLQASTAAGNYGIYMLSVKVATPAVSGTNTVKFIIASGTPTGVMLMVTQINPGITNPISWEF